MNAAQNNPEPAGHPPAPARTSVTRPHTTPLARGRTLLLVDDHHVLYRSGTQRVLQPARRHSREPVVAQTEPWEMAIGWMSVYRHPQTGVYQLWYQAYAGERAWDKRMECVGGVRDKPEQRSGVGLATIPRDRFAGVRPVARSEQATLRQPLENVGQVTFHPLDLGGCSQISLNADATGGSIRVELLTEDGYRLRGYAKGDAVPVQGDALRHPVAWHARRLDELPTGRTILRVHLQHATLFAVS